MKAPEAIITALTLLAIAAPLASCESSPASDIKTPTFRQLDSIREERKHQLVSKLETLRSLAAKAPEDDTLVKSYFALKDKFGAGRAVSSFTGALEKELDQAYLSEYYYFYDILFIDKNGLVFHTIRRESDLGRNIFKSELSSSSLAQTLRQDKDTQFVDYHFYSPSSEPAAFFIAKVTREGQFQGWIAFQYASGALRQILFEETGLGKTCEVYLTNENKVMLSQSRFIGHDTILSLRVETEAVEMAKKDGKGRGIILDYRGVRVFSSYEKFSFAGASWIIIAEIDEDEVLTRWYMENKDLVLKKIFSRLEKGAPSPPREELLALEGVKVDINEYAKAGPGAIITTAGVTTCTGVVIQIPGRFAYIGHIYPLDRVYYNGVQRAILDLYYGAAGSVHGDKVADLLGGMIHEIRHFNIYPSETGRLSATLVATHTNSFARIIDTLIDSGLTLSQIRILNDRDSFYADIAVEVDSGALYTHWASDPGKGSWTSASGAPTLETILKEAIGYGA